MPVLRRGTLVSHLALVFFLALTPYVFVCTVQAKIFAEAEVGYVDYETVQGGSKNSASGLTQSYSLGYLTAARLATLNGYYRALLGYQWSSLDTKIKGPGVSEDISINSGHIFFNGEVLLDPRELPVRVKAYSRDMSRPQFSAIGDTTTFTGYDPVVNPDVPVRLLNDGTHITSGFNLIFGVKNNMSNGYYSVFKDLPQLMVDYTDGISKNSSVLDEENVRTRTLAFILNKKSNWLHYRQTSFDNYVRPNESYVEQQFMFGNIDHKLERHWVDVTNWIKVSGDGTFRKRSGDILDYKQAYEVNLMGILSRETWEARSINNLSAQQRVDGTYDYSSRTPLYVSGTWGIDTDWKTALVYTADKSVLGGVSLANKNDTLALVQVRTFKRSMFTLSPTVSIESVEQDRNKSIIYGAKVESASTRRFSNVMSLIGSYEFRFVNSEGDVTDNSTVQNINGGLAYRPSNRVSVDVTEGISIATGNRNLTLAANTPGSSGTIGSNDSVHGLATGSYLRSTTTARVDWTPMDRMQLVTMASEDYLKDDGNVGDSITSFRSGLIYRNPKFDANGFVTYSQRRGISNSDSMNFTGMVKYTHSRQLSSGARAEYARDNMEGNISSTYYNFEQNLQYAFYSLRGVGRRLLDATETFSYSKREGNQPETQKSIALNTKYYPTQHIYLSASGRYTLVGPIEQKELAGSGEVGVVYAKLQANLNYSYGKREGAFGRIDKRFSANVKKQF